MIQLYERQRIYENTLYYMDNYGYYKELAQTGRQTVYTDSINKHNWNEHLTNILNIFKDGIETEHVQNMLIEVHFSDNEMVDLYIPDYYFNLILWGIIISAEENIKSKHLYFEEAMTIDNIKDYIDEQFVDEYRHLIDNITINNIIDNSLYQFVNVDQFSMYFANTINLEDDIAMMDLYPEYEQLLNTSFNEIPLQDVKDLGMQRTRRVIEYIKNSDHCLSDSFRAKQGINDKQFREWVMNRGVRPDGEGSVYPLILDGSFINGGESIKSLESLIIESATGRLAQIITKMNVGASGYFARLLKLNNRDTKLHDNPHYECDSVRQIKIHIETAQQLKLYENRYYKTVPNGIDFKITKNSKHLIGQTIYLRSPATCASHSRGTGICYKCYGDIAYTNREINIGIMAAELLAAILTQRMLSAKHLLESNIRKLEWSPGFERFFDVEFNTICISKDIEDLKGYKLIIDIDSLDQDSYEDVKEKEKTNKKKKGVYLEEISEDEEDESEGATQYVDYITEFKVRTPNGEYFEIKELNGIELYLTMELRGVIKRYLERHEDKTEVSIDFQTISDEILFAIILGNNELSKTLEQLKAIINKSAVTSKFDIDTICQDFVKTALLGGININAVHLETIISNQIRSTDDPDELEMPRWEFPNEDQRCKIYTLNKSLTNNPSITIALEYQKIKSLFISPLSFRRTKASSMDPYFMEYPQRVMTNRDLVRESNIESDELVSIPAFRRMEENE